MTTITGQKSDGSPITFNFKLANGLPFKPMIEPHHEYLAERGTDTIIVSIELTDEEISQIGEIKKIFSRTDLDNFAIFIEVNDKYILVQSIPDVVLEAVQGGRIAFSFHKKDHNSEFITAFR
ncbi:hypothetical protein [Paraburkholderia tropica]|uniref:hypothetical protein n=1 Tax=Paraburkholderia tropica TaxID=92647 RepID=UPI003D26B29C